MNFKSILLFLFISHISVFNILAQKSDELIKIESFGTNPGNLDLFKYQNNEVKDSSLKPLVLVLHGCNQSAKEISELTGWNKLAEVNDFIVVYPQQKFLNNPSHCFNWFNENDINKGVGECESIFQMITYLKNQYLIDTNKIFITGFSAGAAMSVVLMTAYPNLFSSGAVFAGVAYKVVENTSETFKIITGNINISQPNLLQKVKMQNINYTGKYPKMIVYQGLNDPIVNFKNAQFIINQWTMVFKTDSVPDIANYSFNNVSDITRYSYNDKNNDECVIFYQIENLGHRLLIKPGRNNNEGGKTGLFGVDKGYHSTYQTALDFGLIK